MPHPPLDLLSDVDGRISRVFLALPGYEPDVVPQLLGCLRGVLTALGPEVASVVLHHDAQGVDIAALGGDRTVEPLVWRKPWTLRMPAGTAKIENGVLKLGTLPWADFTPWVQDSFLVGTGARGWTLLASSRVQRPDGGMDDDVPESLAAHLGWNLVTLPGTFEAANVLVDAESIVVGREVFADNDQHTAAALVDTVAPPGGARRRLVIPPEGRQPVAHQDLYLTLAGRDPATGAPLATVGSLDLAAEIVGARHDSEDVQQRLDAVADVLHRLGFRVARVPLHRTRARPKWKPGWVSYNNVLVECWGEAGNTRRRVTLAAYGTDGGAALQELDAAAAAAWRELGFEVRLAEGPFTWLSSLDGGLRCMTKVLARVPQ